MIDRLLLFRARVNGTTLATNGALGSSVHGCPWQSSGSASVARCATCVFASQPRYDSDGMTRSVRCGGLG